MTMARENHVDGSQRPSVKNKKVSKPKKSLVEVLFSLSSVSTLVAIFYVYHAFNSILDIIYPLRSIPHDVLHNVSSEKMVRPFWNNEVGDTVEGLSELGLRVYLSTQDHFTLDYFYHNDDFQNKNQIDEQDRGNAWRKPIRDGKSFLLWSEDNAYEATKTFSSRSFIIVATENDSSSNLCSAIGSCSIEQQQMQSSLQFAHQWLKDSIQHEQQSKSEGSSLISAMNSAGGGIESTSILLTLYSSTQNYMKRIFEIVSATLSSRDKEKGSSISRKESIKREVEEPKSIIYISPQHPLWKSLTNGKAYVHVLIVRQIGSSKSTFKEHLLSSSPNAQAAAVRLQQLHNQHNAIFGRVEMIKKELPLHVKSPKRYLYKDLLFMIQNYGLCPICRLLKVKGGKICSICCISGEKSCIEMVPPWNNAYHQPKAHSEYELASQNKKQGVKYPYWKPEVRIHLIQEKEEYPIDYANRVGFEIIEVSKRSSGSENHHKSGYAYLPAVHVDEIGLTSDKYIPLNETVSALPLRIGFHSGISMKEDGSIHQQGITPARYRLLNHLSSTLESQAKMGFEQSDIDDLRRLIAETNVMLLAVTILASVLHLLFEFLTFKSDVDFWRGNTDLTGLSVRALFFDWMSQVVILLYLIELDSSLLMTVPTAIGMLIALWKCQRGAGFKFIRSTTSTNKSWYNKFFEFFGYELSATRLRAAASSVETGKSDHGKITNSDKPNLAALTEQVDQVATNLLGKYFLIPLVTTYALYSLVNEVHAGWYSWLIVTASSFVYAIGFVLMTPQLFLNYKLKSVAHLPWNVLGFKFVNTFIDDLFAFIIRMPTMARVSCFRDDVVFVIYLWQRFLYPVDTSRPVEGGGESNNYVEACETETTEQEKVDNK